MRSTASRGTDVVARFGTVALALLAATAACLALTASASAEFGITAFDGAVSANPAGDAFTQAGGHPFVASTRIDFNTIVHPTNGPGWPEEPVKNVFVDLPPGLVGNPSGVAQCKTEQIATPNTLPECPAESQIGTVVVASDFGFLVPPLPLYNMVPPTGAPARFSFNFVGALIALDAAVRSGSDYGVSVNSREALQTIAVGGVRVKIWGVPADPVNDAERFCPGVPFPGCTSTAPLRPLLRNPTACTPAGVGLETVVRADSWVDPGDFKTASFESHLPPGLDVEPDPSNWGAPQGPDGCDAVPFDPQLSAAPASNLPDAPTGLEVELSVPQDGLIDPDEVATADLKKAVVRLPEGMSVSASAADGLQACSSAQIALGSDRSPSCPAASKIGTVEVETPLLAEEFPEGAPPTFIPEPKPLHGSVYLAAQGDNPFGSLLAMYIVAEGSGVVVKLAGRVDADPVTGRLTTTFDNQPQLPFSKLTLRLKDGPRAPLATPAECGTHTVETELTSWARPDEVVRSDSSFDILCPGTQGFAPQMVAGSLNPIGGTFSPFALRIRRDDRQQILNGLSLELPQGLLADLSDVDLCPDGLAGDESQPLCPAGSRVGTARVAAGPGSAPFALAGDVFLTGPYKGAPYGLSVQVPAKAGPLDLGLVKVRQALHVDPDDASVSVVSDTLPTIREGIQFRVRSVGADVDRQAFTVNPTSCDEKKVAGTASSTAGAVAGLASRFQVADCTRLALTPKLAMRLTGRKQTTTGGHPALRTRLTQPAGQANIKRVQVKLPKSLALDPENASDPELLCSFEGGKRAECPASSIIGRATAVSPLLKRPLRGPVHFVQGIRVDKVTGRQIRTLPTLLVKLGGEVKLNIRATTSVGKDNRLVTVFPIVPDAKVASFRLDLKGGKRKGILTVTRNQAGPIDLCGGAQSTGLRIRGHNGKLSRQTVRMKTPCARQGKSGKAKRSKRR